MSDHPVPGDGVVVSSDVQLGGEDSVSHVVVLPTPAEVQVGVTVHLVGGVDRGSYRLPKVMEEVM